VSSAIDADEGFMHNLFTGHHKDNITSIARSLYTCVTRLDLTRFHSLCYAVVTVLCVAITLTPVTSCSQKLCGPDVQEALRAECLAQIVDPQTELGRHMRQLTHSLVDAVVEARRKRSRHCTADCSADDVAVKDPHPTEHWNGALRDSGKS
jgi:hypothetical protein